MSATWNIPLHTFHVVLEDGREFDVDTDQRDQRQGFVTAGLDPDKDTIGGLQSIAWAALRRTRQLEGVSWPEFARICTWVVPVTTNGDEAPASVDPTQEDGAD